VEGDGQRALTGRVVAVERVGGEEEARLLLTLVVGDRHEAAGGGVGQAPAADLDLMGPDDGVRYRLGGRSGRLWVILLLRFGHVILLVCLGASWAHIAAIILACDPSQTHMSAPRRYRPGTTRSNSYPRSPVRG